MERTVLPPACGEETLLPGIACVGCAAAVSYHPDRMDGFSVCVIASSAEVNLLGPDRRESKLEEKLFTRTLWRPPRHFQPGGGAVKGPSGSSAAGGSGATRTAAGQRQQAHQGPSGLLAPAGSTGANGHEGNVKIVALLAFLLHPDDGQTGGDDASDTPAASPALSFSSAVPDDTMCVFVAWADDCGRHHVSFLLVSLLAALSSARTSTPILLFQELDALPLEPGQQVLRLFYSHHVGEGMRHAAASARSNPLHLILCSGYRLAAGRDTPDAAAHGASTSAMRGAVDQPAEAAPSRAASGPAAQLSGFFTAWSIAGYSGGVSPHLSEPASGTAAAAAAAPPLVAYLVPSGEWMKAPPTSATRLVSAFESSAWAARPSVRVQRGTESEMPEWLWQFTPDRVVCCFDVMPHGTALMAEGVVGMRAAAGTTDGRVYVLTTQGSRLLRRLAGPIADAAFVVCESTKKTARATTGRSLVMEQLLEEARVQQCSGPSRLVPASSSCDTPQAPDVALVVLDSVGRVVYFLAINKKPTVAPQVVCAVPQLIHLADRETNMLTFVDASPTPSAAAAKEPTATPSATAASASSAAAAASSRNFLDISTLRHFFGARKQKQAVPVLAKEDSHAATGGDPTAHAAPPGEAELVAGACAGHLLSRGLLRIAQLENVNGLPELVISTHGQLLVSIPYDVQEQRFYVAGFTITPSPMHYVQFVDLFGTGCEEIVFAGLESVLVARRSRGTLRERALLLLQLLESRQKLNMPRSTNSRISVEALDV